MDIRQQLQQEIDRHWRLWNLQPPNTDIQAREAWMRIIMSAEEAWRSGTDADVVAWLDALKVTK
jgi:hypothetical protein